MQKTDSPARRLAAVGIFAALTLLATSVLKIPTPTFGYIHIGDGFVLLAGLLLGPVYGGLAAGIGSGLSDLLGGYVVWVPGTFLIKFLTALTAAYVFRLAQKTSDRFGKAAAARRALPIPLAGIAGELVMVAGYFLYNILIVMTAGGDASVSFTAAAALSLAEIPFNLIQGTIGIVLSSLLYPVFSRGVSRYHLSAL